VWSIILEIGNPTNMIVSDAAGFNFSTYFRSMAPAGIASGVTAVGVIYALSLSSFRTVPATVIAQRPGGEVADQDAGATPLQPFRAGACACRLVLLLMFATLDSVTSVPLWQSVGVVFVLSLVMDISMDLAGSDGTQSGCWSTLAKMPWEVAPFALSLFFMVEVLDITGVVSAMARVASAAIGGSRVGASFGIGVASIVACQCLNNQPMTVLFTKILTHSNFNVGQGAGQIAQRALIVGSNLGANVTLIGALAGPLWVGILAQNNIPMNQEKFVMAMVRITPVVAAAALATLLVT